MESLGCVQTHELETPKLPLSATAPAEEHGGTAHALRGARRMRNHGPPSQVHGSWVLHPAGRSTVGGSRRGYTWSTHKGMVIRPHAERLRQPGVL